MIQLTENQLKHLPAVDWLIDDEKGKGKSFLLAVAFIRKAISQEGRFVPVFDVTPFSDVDFKRRLLKKIEYIYANESSLNLEYSLTICSANFSFKLEQRVKESQNLWEIK